MKCKIIIDQTQEEEVLIIAHARTPLVEEIEELVLGSTTELFGYTETEIVRLPKFMSEKKLTGAQIGTALHRILRMTDLEKIRKSGDIAAELARQRAQLLENGVITQAEYDAVPLRMLTDFYASPLGVRMLRSSRVEREWAFTFRRQALV